VAHPNEHRFLEGYELFQKGDLDTIRNGYFTDDVVWHSSGNNALSGDAVGIDAVLENFMKTVQMTADHFGSRSMTASPTTSTEWFWGPLGRSATGRTTSGSSPTSRTSRTASWPSRGS
jgi:hypothetical protein